MFFLGLSWYIIQWPKAITAGDFGGQELTSHCYSHGMDGDLEENTQPANSVDSMLSY